MVERTADHPNWEELLAYGQGRLDPASTQTLEDHLAECSRCCALLETAPADSFLSRLRGADATSDPLDPAIPPELIDHPRYRVLGLVGQGGMGAVYRAVHRRMERVVALKVMRPSLMRQPSAVQRFQQEARMAAQLHHPNIVTAYDADQAGELHFLVMEYVEGRNLADHLREHGPLPIAEACRYARQAALGLQHAHEQGMVHRDVKPHNLMLQTTGEGGGLIKILDFGLARLPRTVEELPSSADRSSGSLTATGAVMGTADYVAPEQAADPRTADGRADIYALGCTLFHLLCGRPPFPEGTVAEKLAHHAKTPLPSLSKLRPETPPELVAVLKRMTAKNPARRYATPAAAVEALTPFCVPIRQPRRSAPPRRRWLVVTALTMTAILFACVLLPGAVALTGWLLLAPANSGNPVQNDNGPVVAEPHQEPIVLDPAPAPVDPAPIAGAAVMDEDPAEHAAIEIVRQHNGFVTQDNTRPNNPVIRVGVEGAGFTDAELRKLASLTQVRKMYAGRSGITGAGFADLTGLKNLVDLDVSQSPVDDDGVKAIARLTQLKILWLSGTKVTDGGLRALASLTQLEELHLSGSRLGDTAAIHVAANVKSLKKLYFDNSAVGDAGVTELAKMPNLQLLTLYGTRVTDGGIKPLTELQTLEDLELSFNVTDRSAAILARCRNLRVLYLFNTQLTDRGLQTLGTLPRLQSLDLRDSKGISIEALTEFIKTHPNCSVKR